MQRTAFGLSRMVSQGYQPERIDFSQNVRSIVRCMSGVVFRMRRVDLEHHSTVTVDLP